MAAFLDYDPVRGVREDMDYTYGDNKLQIHYSEDVEPLLELTKYERHNGLADTAQRKRDDTPRLFARIPPTVILKLRFQYGVNVFSNQRDERYRAYKLIEQDYPHLKTTDMKLFGGRGGARR